MGIVERIRVLLETRKHKRYEVGRELDKGGYRLIRCIERSRLSTVHLAQLKASGQRVAVKVVNEADCMSGERLLWRRIRHDNCLALYHQFTVKGYTHLVCEYAPHGDVLSWLESSGQTLGAHLETLSQRLSRSILEAFQHIHQLQMAHLDFRWTNVLLDSELNAKLTGFSYLSSAQEGDQGLCLGDPLYHPPEAVTTGVNRSHTDKVDMWQLGAALLHLLLGWYIPLFDAKSHDNGCDVAVLMDVAEQTVHLPGRLASCGVSPQFQDFVSRIMRYNPEERLTATQALEHPWIHT